MHKRRNAGAILYNNRTAEDSSRRAKTSDAPASGGDETKMRKIFKAAAFVLAFAALLTVCACLPVCTYIPIIDNGADVVQLAQFMLLSEVFVLVSLYAAGTEEALEIARAEMRNMIRFLIPFMAACASIAAYLIKNGLDTDPFSFNSFSLFGQMRSMSWCGVAGMLLFMLAVLSQAPQRGASSGTLLLEEGELPDYGGAPRGILQIWSVVRSFIVVAVMTYIVFPSELMGTFGESAAIAWSGQAVNFVAQTKEFLEGLQ